MITIRNFCTDKFVYTVEQKTVINFGCEARGCISRLRLFY